MRIARASHPQRLRKIWCTSSTIVYGNVGISRGIFLHNGFFIQVGHPLHRHFDLLINRIFLVGHVVDNSGNIVQPRLDVLKFSRSIGDAIFYTLTLLLEIFNGPSESAFLFLFSRLSSTFMEVFLQNVWDLVKPFCSGFSVLFV